MAEIEVGKFGKKSGIDLSTFKAGLKADKLTAEQKSIFNAIDADKNGVVDEEELEKLKSGLDKNGNNTISKREAKKFLKNNDLKNLDKKEVMKFLKSYLDNTQNVEDAEVVDTAADGQKTVKISYKDGTSEVVNANFISKTDQNGNTVSKYYDDNKTLEKEKRTTSEGDSIEIKYDSDGETPISSLENKKDGTETQIEYKEGKPVTKQVKLGTTKSNYTFDEQGNEILNSKIENEGVPTKERTTNYTYNEDGTVTENIKENAKTTERLRKGDIIISENINDNGKLSKRTYYEKGYEEETTDDKGNPTVNVYSLDNKKLAQQKTIDGQKVSVLYDGEGNTRTIVQNGESPAAIAKKFGCSVEDLLEVNKDVLKGKKYFDVGAEIRVPGEIEADSSALKGRKTSAEAKAEYARDEAIRAQKRAEAAAREAQYKAMGLVNHKGQGKKITGKYDSGRAEDFTVIGEAGKGRHLAKAKNGKIVTISHDGIILDAEYVNNTNLYAKGEKIKGKVRANNGTKSYKTNDYVEIKGANLPHGRKAVVDSKGKVWVMSHDGFILDNNYVAKSNYSDAIKGDKSTAQKATVDMLTSQLDSAQAAFDAQMKEDGWAADVADGISNIWGIFQEDGNQAWRVRKDLKAYRQNINELKSAAKQGDKQFQAKFKQMFGVNYSQAAIADYMMNPTDANYKKAFGTKNNIGQRVAKYNSSQQTGAAVVKGATTVVAGVVVGAATGGTGLVALGVAAGATAASSFAINASDRASSDVGLKEGELGQIAENAAWDGAAVFVGGTFGKAVATTVKGVSTTAALTRAGANAIGDVTLGAAQEYAQTGQITVEGTAINAALGTVGLASESGALKAAGKKVKNMLHKGAKSTNVNIDVPNQSSTPVLDKASSQGNAHPADVKVGKTKAEQIKQEVANTTSKPNVKGDELAQVRNEVGSISDRSVRRSSTRSIDKAADNLPASEKANFETANRANSQANVDHIFDRHNELNATDVRVMNEYIKNTDDISVLQDLQKKLDTKEHTYGGVTANYRALRKSIDDRIAGLQPKPVLTNLEQRESVVSMLGEKAKTGKGLSPDEFNQVNDYISSIGDRAQLKEIQGLLGGKKMTSAQKKQLKASLEAKNNELKLQSQPQIQTSNDATPIKETYVDPHHIRVDGAPTATAPGGSTFEDFTSVQRRLAQEQKASAPSSASTKPEVETDPHHIRLDEAPTAPASSGSTFEGFTSVQRRLAQEQKASAPSSASAKPEVETDPHHIRLDEAPKASAPSGSTVDFVTAQQQLKQKPHDDLVAMLSEKARTGKGLSPDEFKQVNDYISTISNRDQLKELQSLLGGKKMTSAQKKQLKASLEAKNNELRLQTQQRSNPTNDAASSVTPEVEFDPHHITLDGMPQSAATGGSTFNDFTSVQRRLAQEQKASAPASSPAKPEVEVDPHSIRLDGAPTAPATSGSTFNDFTSVQRRLAQEQKASAPASSPVKPEVEADPHHITLDSAPKSTASDGSTVDFVTAQQQLKQKPHDDLVAMLSEKARTGKGLSPAEFNQITDYISTISDSAQLKELKSLLGGKKMTSAQKKQLKEAILDKEKSLA